MSSNELDRKVTYRPQFTLLGLNLASAIFLSQAVSWTYENGGWFTKTMDEWASVTGLSKYQQKYARTKLVDMGVLVEKQQGMPRRIYSCVDFDALNKAIKVVSQ